MKPLAIAAFADRKFLEYKNEPEWLSYFFESFARFIPTAN
jgi:hypothetical protein